MIPDSKNLQTSNFWKWQQTNKPIYKKILKNADLAELYGTILGDGCLEKFERTDKLTISFNRNATDHIRHVSLIIERVFGKIPTTRKRKISHCDDLYFYQKNISNRINFPYSPKISKPLIIPEWIKKNKNFVKVCLKGMFETDGNLNIDNKYKTCVISFSNRCITLLDDLYLVLKKYGYNPQRRMYDVRLARKKEVERFVDWINFKKY